MTSAPFRVAAGYTVAGVLWILVSDWLLATLLPDYLYPGQTVKGLVFVLLSAILVYVLTRREVQARARVEREREELSRRLDTAGRLEAIGRLTAGIAHDFRNLLTVIQGSIAAATAFRVEARGREDELVELKAAAAAARQAEDLTGRLLSFGRSQPLCHEPLDVNRVIEEMGHLLHRLIGPGISIETRLDPRLCLVELDPGRLHQVVMNLALNARDAMPTGGTLALETTNVRLDGPADAGQAGVPPGDYVRLRIVDTGTGMDAATRERVYEPFFTTKDKDLGTGLGLSTVYGIVTQSGGGIHLQSAPGQGTRFDLYFPTVTEEDQPGTPAPPEREVPAPHQPAPPSPNGSASILVVEDETAVRELVLRTLKGRGYTVHAAADAAQALHLADNATRHLDLVVADAGLPDMDGVRLVDRIRDRRPELPALIVSGYAAEELDSSLPYLAKPFTPQQLLTTIHRLLVPADA